MKPKLILVFALALSSASSTAAIFGADDRRTAIDNLEFTKFSKAEYEQVFRCTGRITCPDLKGKNSSWDREISAGAFCPPSARNASGRCLADRIVTAPRVFVNADTNEFYPNFSKCEFSNYLGHKSPLRMTDLTNVIDPKSETDSPYKSVRVDKIVIRLVKPIKNCDPYDIEMGDTAPAGTELIAVTSPQEDTPAAQKAAQPLTYKCTVLKAYAPRYGRAGVMYSDCDLMNGGVGGVTLIRNASGRLLLNGILGNSPEDKFNGVTADVAAKMYTNSAATNGDFLQLAINPGVRPLVEAIPPRPPPTAPVETPSK